MSLPKTAIVLAAGKGERLDLYETPKPLAQIGHRPLIERTIRQLQEVGVEKFVIVLGYEADRVEHDLAFHHGLFPTEPVFVRASDWHGDLFSSVKDAAANMATSVGSESCFVVMSDLILGENPFRELGSKLEEGDIAVLVGLEPEHANVSGASSLASVKDGSILEIGRQIKNPSGREVGAYALSFDALKMLADLDASRSFQSVLQEFADQGKLSAAEIHGPWYDVNTPETFVRAELFLRSQKNENQTQRVLTGKPLPESFSFINEQIIKTNITVERGIIDRLPEYDLLPESYLDSPHYLLTDKNVDALYGEHVLERLRTSGYNISKIVMDPGEAAKSFENYQRLAEEILAQGIEETSVIFTLGGGAVGNVAGFLASTLYRGIGLVHIPTTVMGQVDAAIGIKQGVNGSKGKNLVGSYYSPLAIIADPAFLDKLPERSIRDGLGECLKHGLAQSKAFFDYLMFYEGDITDLDFLETCVKWNIQLKVDVMKSDFSEEREGLVLQYGHEIGHAVEFLSGFKFYHGEAVVIGMRASAELAHLLGIADREVVEQHIALARRYGFEVDIPSSISTDAIIESLKFSKKARDGNRFALVDKLGRLWSSHGEFAIPCDKKLIREAVENSRAST